MGNVFDANKRPEENLAAFFAHLKQHDPELGSLLERELISGDPLDPKDRTGIAKQAVAILMKRSEAAKNA